MDMHVATGRAFQLHSNRRKNMEKNYEQPFIMVKDIYVEDVILSSTGNVSVVDGEATWDGDIFGK